MRNGALLIEARGLELGYRGHTVLRDVDLEVRAGETWFLLGPNGCGKTTLLRAVLGLLAPARGELRRDARLAAPERLGYVPQLSQINPSLATTVREFVSLGLAGLRLAREEREGRIAWALDRVDLAELASRDYWWLSGGQRRRALLARGLVRRPAWMVLDEPTEGLDVETERTVLATLDGLRRDEGTTLLVVTHRMEIARRFASHVAVFRDGRVRSGARDAVLSEQNA